MNTRRLVRAFSLVALMSGMLLGLMSRPLEAGAKSGGAPQVVVISLDGARADIVEAFLRSGVLDKNVGLGRLDSRGVVSRQNITLTPSLDSGLSHRNRDGLELCAERHPIQHLPSRGRDDRHEHQRLRCAHRWLCAESAGRRAVSDRRALVGSPSAGRQEGRDGDLARE
jgi:hypothetical protein